MFAVGVVATALIVFQRARHGEFLAWDDDINITNNRHVYGLTWENVVWMFTSTDYIRRYVPLAWLNWAIDYEWFGLTPRSAHIGNILFHAANSMLVFAVIRSVLRIWRPAASGGGADLAAAAAALVWALHPLRVEVVAWASGRIYCQATFFVLLAMLAYLRAAQSPANVRRGWLGAAVIAFTLSLLTYPIGITFFAVLVIVDVYLLRRFSGGARAGWDPRSRGCVLEKLPFLTVAVVVAAVTLFARYTAGPLWPASPSLEQFGVTARIAQGFYVWAHYVWRHFAPMELAPVYTTLVDFDPKSWLFIASGLAVVATTIVLAVKRRAWPGAFALWLVHLVLLVPMLGFTERPHYANDRYAYLQGVALSVAIGGGILSLRSRVAQGTAVAIAGAVIVVLGASSVAQIRIWRDSETLFRFLHARLHADPYRADISMRLGETLRAQGRFAEASGFYREALRIKPADLRAAISHAGLAKIARREGRIPEAVNHLNDAVRVNPNFGSAYHALGELLLEAGQPADAVAVLSRAVRLDAANTDARRLLDQARSQAAR